jgi:hypothetical protein
MFQKTILALMLIVSGLAVLTGPEAVAQVAPAGLTVVQNPAGVYYVFYSDSVQPTRSQFYYLNYSTKEFDAISPTLSSNGFFSGTSPTTGKILNGSVQATGILLTYDGVTTSGLKESLYGPTRQLAGLWMGTISDPTVGIGFGELIVSSHNECLVFYLQGFQFTAGIGTINSNGFATVPLLSGVTLSGTFAPANGNAQGIFTYSTGGRNTYAFVKAVTSRLANISTRGVVGSGEQVLIAGLIVTDGGKTVLINALGPTLAASGVTGFVQNPRLELFLGNQLIASNANWKSNANASEISASGVAPTDDREASLQVNLEPGTYTAIVSSEDATSGIGLVEVYGVGSPLGY